MMRSFLLSMRGTFQVIFIIGLTIILAFSIAGICSVFFDIHQLKANTDLISSVYQVLGTVYAILLTFTLWGVWQNFNVADAAAQNEAYTLLDLVHMIEISSAWKNVNIRHAALVYLKSLVDEEWVTLKTITSEIINLHEHAHSRCSEIINVVQNITPANEREVTLFNQALTLLNRWLDARRTRILIARGNSAKALWPLLITGAVVLFAFNGLFVTETIGIWTTLLFGFSLIIGLTFYLIFSLDCPFTGSLSIDTEPFDLAINILSSTEKPKN